ncbi:pentapeptide repeat-containing protein [Croceivirga thetidis]|uniref:Pentapeptide repeat-containing protein n=1 Tax=Croceivirga thetidis TaxID=2721623 RepID=A0ABX1GQE6_9FLAO|nr:pentapeptide repeat-containing protein [Croceivirga thetidis]NKI31819.1 pentapeptide repeat-containing protein [Croceivirga thetidis]
MADNKQLELLKNGTAAWNEWRSKEPEVEVDLKSADLLGADLRGINFKNADLRRINLRDVNLSGANLEGAQLYRANLNGVNLINANLKQANLYRAYLGRADLSEADLHSSNLQMSLFSQTKIEGANLKSARVYGISTWNLVGTPKDQSSLVITADEEAEVTVDDIKMAQFIYLLLANNELRDVIQTVTSKAVLILGRFYEERKQVLDALRETLRKKDFAPIIFDFEPSNNRNLTETIQLLASLSKFIIADLSDAKSIPQELSVIIPSFPSIPIAPILVAGEQEYSMFEHWNAFESVLSIFRYKSQEHLLANLDDQILDPIEKWQLGTDAESKAERELRKQKEKFESLKNSDPELYGQLLAAGVVE